MPDSPRSYQPLLERYARYAPVYDRRFARYSMKTLQRALQSIPPHEPHPAHNGSNQDGMQQSLLDVACGTGFFIDMLRMERPDIRTVGVDVSSEMLQQARQRVAESEHRQWREGQAEQLPADEAEFDVITCNNAFHLVQDAAAALREFRRVLKPGGTLILVDWCADFPQMSAMVLVQRLTDRQKRSLRTLRELTSLLGEAGFDVQQQERFVVPPLWGMMRVVAKSAAPVVKRQNDRVLQQA